MASMSYLQLCQAAHRLLRIGNATPGSLPAALPLTGNPDQAVYDIVDAVPRAWEWVQNQHPSWNFMRKSNVFVLTSGLRQYLLSQIQAIIPDYYGFIPFWSESNTPYFLMYDSGFSPVNQRPDYIFPFVEYQEWRGFWDRGPRPANGQPNRMTEQPNKTLEFDPTPAAAPSGSAWGIKFDYRIVNQVLSNQSDVPILPAEFHDLIVWVAVRFVCETRMNSGPLYQAALQQIDEYMAKLVARYTPQLQVDLSYA